jgi:hypothetical protein
VVVTHDMVDMQLRHHVAQSRHIQFVGTKFRRHVATQAHRFIQQQKLVIRRQFIDLADIIPLRYQDAPGVAGVVE